MTGTTINKTKIDVTLDGSSIPADAQKIGRQAAAGLSAAARQAESAWSCRSGSRGFGPPGGFAPLGFGGRPAGGRPPGFDQRHHADQRHKDAVFGTPQVRQAMRAMGVGGGLAVGLAGGAIGGVAGAATYAAFSVAERALSSLAGVAEQMGRTAVTVAAQMETLGASLEVLSGSKRTGRELLSGIQDLAVKSPFRTTELADQAKRLLAYGVPSGDLLPTLGRIGDVASGTGAEFGRLSLAYGQSLSLGRLQGTELRQFTEAGVGVRDFAREAGTSVSGLRDLMDQGRVSSDVVVKAFDAMTSAGGRFFSMMERRNKTVQGQWEAMSENFERVFGGVGLRAFERFDVAGRLGRANDFVSGFSTTAIDKYIGRVQAAFAPLTDTMRAFADTTLHQMRLGFLMSAPSVEEFGKGLNKFAVDFIPPALDAAKDLSLAILKLGRSAAEVAPLMLRIGASVYGGDEWRRAADTFEKSLRRIGQSISGLEPLTPGDDFRRKLGGKSMLLEEQISPKSNPHFGRGRLFDFAFGNMRTAPGPEGFIQPDRALFEKVTSHLGGSIGMKNLVDAAVGGMPHLQFMMPRSKGLGMDLFGQLFDARVNMDDIMQRARPTQIGDPGRPVGPAVESQSQAAQKRIERFFIDSMTVFDKMFKGAADRFKPGMMSRIESLAKTVTPDAMMSPLDRFKQTTGDIGVGRQMGFLGLDGGLSAKQADRLRYNAFRELQDAVKPVERQPAPLLGSNTAAAESALTKAFLVSQDKKADPAEALADLMRRAVELAEKEQKDVERIARAVAGLQIGGGMVGVGPGGGIGAAFGGAVFGAMGS